MSWSVFNIAFYVTVIVAVIVMHVRINALERHVFMVISILQMLGTILDHVKDILDVEEV